MDLDLSKYDFLRLANNHLMLEKNGDYSVEDLNVLNRYFANILKPEFRDLPSYKVGVIMVCVNQPYWPYLQPIINDMRTMLLPGHTKEFHIWSDILTSDPEADKKLNATIHPVEPIEWPHGTLLRYNLFLQQEEKLQDYDYLFYIDVDMRMVNVVGDEILGEGLTMAEHPMYAVRQEYIPPYEPNQNSTAYIKRFGTILNENGKQRLKPLYAAGGFQGGKTKDFIQAMKVMRKNIDKDFTNNYVAIWNDESHWNKYLSDIYEGKVIVLSPSYIFPDSLIDEYYVKVWGRKYPPKIVTLTKAFSTTPEAGAQLRDKLKTI
jgi:hypothetical protein